MSNLSKKELEHLAELARLDLKPGEEEKLQKDLGAILDYFKELETLDTEGVEPMTGGTELKSVVREDELATSDPASAQGYGGQSKRQARSERLKEAFPSEQGGYLKVPPVF